MVEPLLIKRNLIPQWLCGYHSLQKASDWPLNSKPVIHDRSASKRCLRVELSKEIFAFWGVYEQQSLC